MCKKSNATPTGFPALDTALSGGLRPGLILVAGRPGMGKTTFLGQIAGHCSRNRVWVKDELTPEFAEDVTKAASIGKGLLFLDRDNAPPAVTGGMLANLARENGISILASTGIPRDLLENRKDKRPQLFDLCRDRPDLVEAADVVIGLYRDHYYHFENSENENEAELLLLKNTWGETGIIPMTFDPWKRVWEEV